MGHQVTMQMSSQLWYEGYQIYPDTNLATHSSTQSSNESGNMRLVWEGPEGGNLFYFITYGQFLVSTFYMLSI